MSAAGQFWAELRRRRVIRTAVAYVLVAWVIIEVATTVFPPLLLPGWTVTLVTVLAILAFPLVLVLAWVYDIRGGATGPVIARTSDDILAPAPAADPAADSDPAAVAVLPFESLGADPDRAYLAQSLASELHLTFSRVPRLRVASRVSSFAYTGVRDNLRRIGQSLNVRYVVSGAVTSIGERLRVTVAIDDAHGDAQIWTRSYDGVQDTVLELLQQIAADTASAFGGVQLEQEMRRALRVPAQNLDAWTRVQRARAYLLDPSPASFDEALHLLEEAIDLEPDYAVAAAAMAAALGDRALHGFAEDLDRDGERALELADRAAELAPGDSFVLKLSGGAAALFGDNASAMRRLRRAVQLAPFDLGARGYLGWPLSASGNAADLEELHSSMSAMLESAPAHPGAPYWLLHRSVALSCSGEPAAAADLAARAVEQNPRFAMAWFQYCNALGALGETDRARDLLARAARSGNAVNLGALGKLVFRACTDANWRRARTEGVRSALPGTID